MKPKKRKKKNDTQEVGLIKCSKQIIDPDELDEHFSLLLRTWNAGVFCEKCSYISNNRFKSSSRLKTHLKNKHNRSIEFDAPYICGFAKCRNQFKIKAQCVEHIKKVHSSSTSNFECDEYLSSEDSSLNDETEVNKVKLMCCGNEVPLEVFSPYYFCEKPMCQMKYFLSCCTKKVVVSSFWKHCTDCNKCHLTFLNCKC